MTLSDASLGSQNQGDFRLQTEPYLEYGNADFDVRHRFVVNFVYNLPFGNGQHFGSNLTGIANQIVGNWQVTGIVSAQTGNWFTPTDDSGEHLQFRLRRSRLQLRASQRGGKSERGALPAGNAV